MWELDHVYMVVVREYQACWLSTYLHAGTSCNWFRILRTNLSTLMSCDDKEVNPVLVVMDTAVTRQIKRIWGSRGLHFVIQPCKVCYQSMICYTAPKKSKAIPVTGRGGPYGCETSRLPHFPDNPLKDGGEVVSLTRRPPFTPSNIPGTYFC
jgi:hypothetical protein